MKNNQGAAIIFSPLGVWLCLLATIVPVFAKPRPAAPPMPETHLQLWRFDTAAEFTGTNKSPADVHGVTSSESWSGYSLRVAGDKPARIAFPEINAAGKTNLAFNHGAVRLWFRGDWSSAGLGGKGPSSDARLLSLHSAAKARVIERALVFDPSGDSLYCADVNGEQLLQARISWPAGSWHQMVLNYSATGTALFLDGALAAKGQGVTAWPKTAERFFTLGSDAHGENLVQGEFEEFTTFARNLTPEEIAWNYRSYAATAQLGPITSEEEAAKPKHHASLKAAGPSGQTAMQLSSPASPGGSIGGTNYPVVAAPLTPDVLGVLSLSIRPNTNNDVDIIARHTLPYIRYQLLTATNLGGAPVPAGDPVWSDENNILFNASKTTPASFFTVTQVANIFAPTVNIIAPTNGWTNSGYSEIEIVAVASVAPGLKVIHTALYDNETNKLGELVSDYGSTNITFRVPAIDLHPGNHQFRVMVEDSSTPVGFGDGQIGWSAPLNVVVDVPVWFADSSHLEWVPGTFNPVGGFLHFTAFIKDEYRSCPGRLGFCWYHSVEIRDGTNQIVFTNAPTPVPLDGLVEKSLYFTNSSGALTGPQSESYEVKIRLFPVFFQAGNASPSQDATVPAVVVTKSLYRETMPPTNVPPHAVVANQNIYKGFAVAMLAGAAALSDSMSNVAEICALKYSVGPSVNSTNSFTISDNRSMLEFVWDVKRPESSILFLVGHGGASYLFHPGDETGGNDVSLPVDFFRNQLGNKGPNGKGQNNHPYRCAIILACNAGRKDGHLFEAILGIPQEGGIDGPWLIKNGLTARAGLGFTGTKVYGVANNPYPPLISAPQRLMEEWTKPDLSGVTPTLKDALRLAANPPSTSTNAANATLQNNARIIGDESLRF